MSHQHTRTAVLLLVLSAAAFTAYAQSGAAQPATGFAVKKPVLAGACRVCPWGALGEIVRDMLAFEGWDVQVCYNCNRADSVRYVADAWEPRPWFLHETLPEPLAPHNPPGLGRVDFGITSLRGAQSAYLGVDAYANEEARKNLRLIARIQAPSYMMVAVRAETGITDLSQLRDKRWPVKVYVRGRGAEDTILSYYGLSKESIEAAGGRVSSEVKDRDDFDVIIHPGGGPSTAPEWSVWNQVTQKFDLVFLQLPDNLIAELSKETGQYIGTIPAGLYRGILHPIKTSVRSGHIIYGRDDMPDEFAYAAAKAIDEHQDLLQWANQIFSYNVHNVWDAGEIPLHPGAERYYKERGYIK